MQMMYWAKRGMTRRGGMVSTVAMGRKGGRRGSMHDTPRDAEFFLCLSRRFLFFVSSGPLDPVSLLLASGGAGGLECWLRCWVPGSRKKEMRYPFRRGPSRPVLAVQTRECRGVMYQSGYPVRKSGTCIPHPRSVFDPHRPRQAPISRARGSKDPKQPYLVSPGGRGNRLVPESALAGLVPIAGDACSCILRTARLASRRMDAGR